jgi:hypothetical protein
MHLFQKENEDGCDCDNLDLLGIVVPLVVLRQTTKAQSRNRVAQEGHQNW